MKKSLLALAVLGAFAGAASAQSSVTIYGIIDLGVMKLNNGTSALVPGPVAPASVSDRWSMKPNTSNRVGFRGTEDLGNGLKANFQFEHRFRPDTGTPEVGTFWQGASWVGLSSATLGEVRLGRDYIPAFYTALAGDPWGYDYNVAGFAGFSRAGNNARAVANTPFADDGARNANQLSYKTPNFAGFTAMVAVAPGEGSQDATLPDGTANPNFNVNTNTWGANVVYSAGPLYASAAYNNVNRADAFDNRLAVGTIAYDLGFVRPSFLYAKADNGVAGGVQAETTSWILGATAPLGGGVLKAGYGISENDVTTVETKKFGLGYQYNLSKRTSVHADIGSAKTDNATRTTGYEVGVKHVF